MTKHLKNKLSGTLIVPLGLAIVLIPYSLMIEMNLASLILYWLVITPGLAIYLPTLVSTSNNHFLESLSGMAIFYALMIFMIYENYRSDYFQFMIWSFIPNLIVVSFTTWLRIPAAKTR